MGGSPVAPMDDIDKYLGSSDSEEDGKNKWYLIYPFISDKEEEVEKMMSCFKVVITMSLELWYRQSFVTPNSKEIEHTRNFLSTLLLQI